MSDRDFTLFPEDETGNVLWQLLNQGYDLAQSVELEFSVIFQTETQALEFGQLLLANHQKISFSPYESHATHPWEITAYPTMPLSHHNITGYQQLLASHLTQYNGLFDGWYCPATA